MNTSSKIYVAGHRGMVGSAICRKLLKEGYNNIITRSHSELDLLDSKTVHDFYTLEKPDIVVIAAAKVGGIGANSRENSRFLYENEIIAMNTIWNAAMCNIPRLLFLGSTCIYPKDSFNPISEKSLLTGPLEKTNEGYALAKISGIKLCEFLRKDRGLIYHSLMPTNLYGPGDNYNIENGHVLPTLIRKFETNNDRVVLWGTGAPLREFLHVDDLASACLFALQLENPPDLMNIGSGKEISIKDLAELVKKVTKSKAKIIWDSTKPDGMKRKLCDCTLINSLGWNSSISLEEGLYNTVDSYRKELEDGTVRL